MHLMARRPAHMGDRSPLALRAILATALPDAHANLIVALFGKDASYTAR